MEAKRRTTIPAEDTSVFCEQIALILSAGMPLHDGVEALSEHYVDTRDGATFKQIARCVTQTGSLGDALEESGLFPAYMVEMTHVGEKTGKTEAVMQSMAVYYHRESKIRHAITNAITYPLVLMVMMACVIAILITKVLPIFEQALSGMGLQMTSASNVLMSFGMNTGKVVMILIGVLLVLLLIVLVLMKTRLNGKIKILLSRIFPPVSKLNTRISGARFASVMSMMMQSGFPLEESLKMMPSIITEETARRRVEDIDKQMQDGMSFPDALDKSGMFDGLYSRMIHMGYFAGQMDNVMEKVANIYEEEVDEGITRLVAIIEPSLVALLSVVIGAILLSVMLPMASIISSII